MACLEPLRLALELWDLDAARDELWDVALSVSDLSTIAVKEIETLCNISREKAGDYALFICAMSLYEVWGQARMIAELLNIGSDELRELDVYRLEYFQSLKSEVRSTVAVSTGGSPVKKVHYNISSAYLTLARAISSSATQLAASAFYSGVAVGCIAGASRCVEALSALLAETNRKLDKKTLDSIWDPAEDAWKKVGDYASNLGVDLSRTLGRAPSQEQLQSGEVDSIRRSIEACDELFSSSLSP